MGCKTNKTPNIRDISNEKQNAFYVKDLQAKLEVYRDREEYLQNEIDQMKRSANAVSPNSMFPLMKSTSFAGNFKNIPQDSQEQAPFFFKKLLRAESSRKALVW